MIVHDKNLLNNLYLLEEVDSLQKSGFLSKKQKIIIKEKLLALKGNNNILVRLGFFLLGAFLYSSICGTFSLLGIDSGQVFWKICFYLFSLIGIVGSELLANLKYYRHGLDDAFILGTLLNIGIAIGFTTNGDEIVISSFIAIASFLVYLRYIHLLSIFIFCLASSAILFYGMFEFGTIEKTILPFVIMLFSAGFYFFTKKTLNNLKEHYYYKGILLANSFCLLLFYLSCNYLVVREFSEVLIGNKVLPGNDIPFALFFYAFTLIVPIIYFLQALNTKDRIMLWIGFLTIGFSIYTIRFYYSVLPIEIALTLGGFMLFTVAYFSIKKLKDKESGLTFKPDRINTSNVFLNTEMLIVASQVGLKHEVAKESPMEFGGGGFSGGGSGGNF
jgi:hypothetical protein